jgi:fibronectin-binding autotransporter adhesin
VANNVTANTITIGAGRTLAINGNVVVGNGTGGGQTLVTTAGGGTLAVTGTTFNVGSTIGSTNNASRSTLDLSGLANLTASLSGALTIQPTGDNTGTAASRFILAATSNAITVPSVLIGNSSTGAVQTLRLGAGTNVVNTNLINLGSGSRDTGVLDFAGPTGSLTLRNLAGTGRVGNVNLGRQATEGTGYTTANVVDFSGHSADVAIGTLAMSLGAKTAANTNDFLFDQGTLDILTVNMAVTKGAGTSVNRLVIGGGTVRLGGSTAFGDAGTGAVTLATAGSGELAISGGTVTSTTNFVKGTGGTGTAILTLSGGTLDMGGRSIGLAAQLIDTVSFTAGTLANVGQFNNGGTLTKTGAGTLTLTGTNTYTGATAIQAGELRAGAAGGLNAASTFAVGSGTFLSLAGNSAAVGGLTGTGTVRNAAATGGTLTVAAGGSTFTGLIEDGVGGGPLALATSGSGIFTLASANTYTGGTAVNAGRLVATNTAALGTGNVTIASGAALELDITPLLGGSAIAMSPGGGLRVASGVAAPLAGLSSLGGWEIDPSTLGLATVGRLLSGTVLAGGTTLTGAWVGPRTPDFYSDILALSGTGAGNPFVLSMTYDPAVEAGLLAGLNIGRRNDGSSDPFAPLGTAFQGVGVPWTSAFTTVGQYGVDTTSQTVWVVSDTNSEFVIVPEPATLGLAGAAAAVGAAWALRRRRAGRSRIG